jgi:hypothetical protein
MSPKLPVIPNSDKPELAEVWRNEGSPSYSRDLYKKDVNKDELQKEGKLNILIFNNIYQITIKIILHE